MKAPVAKALERMQRPAAAALAVALSLATLAGCAGSAGPAAGSTQTQTDGTSAAGGRHRMAQVLLSLGLTSVQQDQIRGIMRDARAKSRNADPDTRRANYKAALAKIDTVLTPNQQKRFEAKMAELRKQQRQGSQSQSQS